MKPSEDGNPTSIVGHAKNAPFGLSSKSRLKHNFFVFVWSEAVSTSREHHFDIKMTFFAHLDKKLQLCKSGRFFLS